MAGLATDKRHLGYCIVIKDGNDNYYCNHCYRRNSSGKLVTHRGTCRFMSTNMSN